MINQPDTHDLLTEARRVLMDSLVPGLEGERKYEALMIANAMGMAIRELEQCELGEPDATDRLLSAFLADHALDEAMENAELSLASAVRQRQLDGDDPELRSILRAVTEARLRINNPGYLT